LTAYVGLLRAVNVGGTGKLPMSALKAIGEAAGFADVRTYIASGNLLFTSALPEAKAKAVLEQRLHAYAGKPVGAMVRTAGELAQVLAGDPFPHALAKFKVAIFLDAAPPADALAAVIGQADEQLALGRREIYVHYGSGMGRSKLRIPAARAGTARNMNTVAKLVALSRG
jgi:uncharacterized protein (DUF1697 family)